MKKDLRVVDELARKLRKKRMRRGALDLDLPEARVVLDPNTGAPVDVARRAQDPGVKRAYQMIEELMLLANELVARWLTKRKAPAIYRVHGKPDEQKLVRLGEIAQRLGAPFELDEMPEPLGVNRWLRRIAEHPRRQVLEMLLLRSLKQAVYDIVNIGHFGLASENYLHFTSPIRRYPDMLVHRSVKHLLRGRQAGHLGFRDRDSAHGRHDLERPRARGDGRRARGRRSVSRALDARSRRRRSRGNRDQRLGRRGLRHASTSRSSTCWCAGRRSVPIATSRPRTSSARSACARATRSSSAIAWS